MNELVLLGAGVVNLGLGYFIGHKLKAAATDGLAESIHQLGQHTSDQLEQHLRRIDTVDSRLSRQFPNTAQATQADDEIRNVIIELRDANQKLQSDLQRTQNELRSIRRRQRRARGDRQSVETVAVVDNLKLPSLTAQISGSGDTAYQDEAIVERDRPSSSRRSFDVEQLVAPYDFGVIPAASDFQAVKCWDIGSDGFSFLLPKPPSFQTLILVLSKSAEKTYLSARVIKIKAFVHRGIDEYHVDCQFITRLPTVAGPASKTPPSDSSNANLKR